jgi:predicted RNase H-like HicB family nuclease
MPGQEIVFIVTPCPETGGYVARWDADANQGGITTQGETLAELEEMITDAVAGYFEGQERPRLVKLHFVEDPVLDLKLAA